MMTQTSFNLVTRELVPEARRMSVTGKYFGLHFPLQLEPVIYGITERMAEDYNGGYWEFWTLSNEGFYMAPSEDRIFHVKCCMCRSRHAVICRCSTPERKPPHPERFV